MEESVEIIIYLGAGIIVLILIMALLLNWKIDKDTSFLNYLFKKGDTMNDNTSIVFDRVNKDVFAIKAYNFWLNCGNNELNNTLRLYVYDNSSSLFGNLSMDYLFDVYKQLNWCKSIQSSSNQCGGREDVNMSAITLPKVVSLTCTNTSLTIR